MKIDRRQCKKPIEKVVARSLWENSRQTITVVPSYTIDDSILMFTIPVEARLERGVASCGISLAEARELANAILEMTSA